MSKQHEYCVVLSTAGTQKNKDEIIKGLLEGKLAACIQTMAIESHYVWKGQVCNDNEWLLIVKTRKDLYALVEDKIKDLHEYEVPQIVQIPIVEGFNSYLEWLRQSTLSCQ